MAKIHHTSDRSIEHAKSREDMAHRLITPDGKALRSTRGFVSGDIVDGKTVHAQPAVDVQPRHGGKAKGGVVAHSWGNTPQQIAQDGTRHLIEGAPDASSASPLDTLSTSQYGKRLPTPPLHPAMNSGVERGPEGSTGATYDPSTAHRVMDNAYRSPDDYTKLPATVREEDCDNG